MQTNIPGRPAIVLVSYYKEFSEYYPDCELATKKWFVENIKENWVLFDCGANIGYFTILFSKLALNGHVYAFEPTSTFSMLQRNLAFHQVKNVTLIKSALGNSNGLRRDNIYRIWGGNPEQREYLFTTIDHFVEKEGIQHIDCIKIDVDSFDFEVLQGAERTLIKFNPFVMVKLNHALNKRNQSNAQALEWLSRLGYKQAVVFDYDNFLLKRNLPETYHGLSGITLTFPQDNQIDQNAARDHNVILEASPATLIPEYGLDVPTVQVFDVHKILGFDAPIDYPQSSLNKKYTQWKMEVDDAPIFRYIYRNFRPRRHLEFGTWLGKGTVFCLEESEATVWTVNLPFGEGAYGFCNEELPDAQAWARRVGMTHSDNYSSDALGFIGKFYLERNLGNRVCQIYSDSRDWDTSNIPEGFFDTILIDGGHKKESVINDTHKAIPLLRPGGLMMWHDFCPPEYQNFEACRGVMAGLSQEWNYINDQMGHVFWIYPSMILIGVKKSDGAVYQQPDTSRIPEIATPDPAAGEKKVSDSHSGSSRSPLVSLIVICLNGMPHIKACVDSLLAQNYPNIEIVVQDGGSQDGTAELLHTYGDRIKLVSAPDSGHGEAMNRALQRCQGEIIGTCNADDVLLPQAVSWAVDYFARFPETGAVYGDYYEINEQGGICSGLRTGPAAFNLERVLCLEEIIPMQSAFFKKSTLEKAGLLFNGWMPGLCEDFLFWINLGLVAQIRYCPGAISQYRVHTGSGTHQPNLWGRIYSAKREVLERFFVRPDISYELRALRAKALGGLALSVAGMFIMHFGDIPAGMEYIRLAREEQPDKPHLDHLFKTIRLWMGPVGKYISTAIESMEAGDHDAALKRLADIKAIDFWFPQVNIVQAHILFSLGRKEKACEILQRELTMRPNNTEAVKLMAQSGTVSAGIKISLT